MDFRSACKILCECVDEFYPLKKGAFISESENFFLFSDVIIGRRSIKHVIEQRKAERVYPEDIKRLLNRVLMTINKFDFESSNPNQLDYPKSIMRAKIFSEWNKGIIIVLDKKDATGKRKFVTAFYCRPARIIFMRRKKPQ